MQTFINIKQIFNFFQTGNEAVSNQADIENHLELGKEFLSKGQLADALTHYHAAVGTFCHIIGKSSS